MKRRHCVPTPLVTRVPFIARISGASKARLMSRRHDCDREGVVWLCSNTWLHSSGNMIQGCLLRVQKCTVGRSQEVSCKVPARTLRNGLVDAPLPLRAFSLSFASAT
jgi:hypothetical protein